MHKFLVVLYLAELFAEGLALVKVLETLGKGLSELQVFEDADSGHHVESLQIDTGHDEHWVLPDAVDVLFVDVVVPLAMVKFFLNDLLLVLQIAHRFLL